MSVLVGLGAGLAAQSVQDISATTNLARLNAAYFVIGDREADGGLSTEPLREELMARLVSGSYTMNLRNDASTTRHVIVVYGSFLGAFGITEPPIAPPYALAGARSGVPVGASITVNGKTVTVAAIMKSAGFVDLWMQYSSLDDAILVVGDPRTDIARAPDEQLLELASRLVLVQPSEQSVAQYLSIARKHLPLFPRWVADKVRLDFAPELSGRVAFLAVFTAGLLATVIGAFSGVRALVQSSFRDLVIHQAVGARQSYVAARLSAFVVASWLVPSLLLGAVGLRLVAGGAYLPTVFPWIVLLGVVAAAAITAVATARVMRADALAEVRESVW